MDRRLNHREQINDFNDRTKKELNITKETSLYNIEITEKQKKNYLKYIDKNRLE